MKNRLKYFLSMLVGGIVGALITMFAGGWFCWENLGVAVLTVSTFLLLLLLLQVLISYLARKFK